LLVTSIKKINQSLAAWFFFMSLQLCKHSVGNNIQKYFDAGPAGAKQKFLPGRSTLMFDLRTLTKHTNTSSG